MTLAPEKIVALNPPHDWLHPIQVAFPIEPGDPVLQSLVSALADQFQRLGHTVQTTPDDRTDILFTTAPFGRPVSWRDSYLFTGRRRFGLTRTPAVVTLIHAPPAELGRQLDYFERVLAKDPPDPNDYAFPGLASEAWRTLVEQGLRGGPLMALGRLMQAQSKSIRILLVVGDEQPDYAYLFDLVGAFPRIDASDPEFFFGDITLRLVTAASTFEITRHQLVGDRIPRATWDNSHAPRAMLETSHQLGRRKFFTEMVRVAALVNVPALDDAVADQYSEGCFATWEPKFDGLVATITGSARPVDKTAITEDDLAVIVGVRPDGLGALVRHVEDKRNDKPSSEAVEMMDMDGLLPSIVLGQAWGEFASQPVPVSRSKLHGHRGVAAYDSRLVEFAPLDPPYYYYPVSCSTEAQARAIKAAFARAQTLQNPADPRQLAFTVLPGHGIVIVEKWAAGKVPFQMMWEYMDAGWLQIENRIPQGWLDYAPDSGNGARMLLKVW